MFVEDKLSALRAAEADPGLGGWELWLAEWGYVTRADVDAVARQEAAGGRVRVLRAGQLGAVLAA